MTDADLRTTIDDAVAATRATGILTGTPIGTPGSYGNNGNTLAKLFDGDAATFFDAPVASGAWAGLDLGTPQRVASVAFIPRAGNYADRMIGGRFEGSPTADFSAGVVTLATITARPAKGVLTAIDVVPAAALLSFRFVRYVSPPGSYCNANEIQFRRLRAAEGKLMPLSFVLVAKPGAVTIPPPPVPPVEPPPTPVVPDVVGMSPFGVHLNAVDAGVTDANLRDKLPTFDFGDAQRFPVYQGATAGNVYDAVGDRTVTRTVPGSPTRKWVVRVTADTRRRVYLSAAGNNAADGTTEATAVQTWARARQLMGTGERAKLSIRRGDTFALTQTLVITGADAWVTTYGTGASPVLQIDYLAGQGQTGIRLSGNRQVVEGLTFDTINAPAFEQSGMPFAIVAGGTAVTIRDNTFLNVGYGVNANAGPVGMLLMSNASPLLTGVRGYTFWVQGSDVVALDNEVANSTREHCCRLAAFTRATVSYNRFRNRTNPTGADAKDISKGTITGQRGSGLVVIGNDLGDGDLGVGPLGGDVGFDQRDMRTSGAYVADNRVSRARVNVYHGAEHVTFRNNVVDADNNFGILVQGFDARYGRTCDDVLLEHNAILNGGTNGNGFRIDRGATGVQLVANLYNAPNLYTVSGGSAVYVIDAASIVRSEGNRWGEPGKLGNKTGGGVCVIGDVYESRAAMLIRTPLDAVVAIGPGVLSLGGAGLSDASKVPAAAE